MRSARTLSVDISELLRRPGASEALDMDVPLEGVSVELAEVEPGSTLRVSLRLESLVNGIHVSGSVVGPVIVRCRRCLKEIPEQLDVRVDELFMRPGDEAIDADAYVIDDETLNLEPMVRDVAVLALPLNPLCEDECRGLCPVCGADLNERDCGHDARPVDVRWGPLERLREQMEG